MKLFLRVLTLLSVILFTACSKEDSPTAAPANAAAAAGENLAAVSWDTTPEITYWVYYKLGTSVDSQNYDGIFYNVISPYLVRNLSNGSEYAFTVTSSHKGSPVGPFSPVLTATPRLLSPTVAWTDGTPFTSNTLNGIAYGANIYVTVGDAGSLFVAQYSYGEAGGVTAWNPATTLPITTATNLTSVLFDGIRFLALGSDGSVIKSNSVDVLSWESASGISGASTMNSITVGLGRYVAVGNGGQVYTNTGDAASGTWTAQTSNTTNDLYSVSYLNGQFVAVGAMGTLLTSADGVSWAVRASNISSNLQTVAYGASTYVAVGDAGAITSSPDAITWAAQTTLPGGQSLRSITFGIDNQFIAVGTAGTLAYSASGADGSWAISNAGSVDLNSIASNLVFIATGVAGANVSGK